jgi:hypothetical protein
MFMLKKKRNNERKKKILYDLKNSDEVFTRTVGK